MFNMMSIMQQAQDLKQKMQNVQTEMASLEFEGRAGGLVSAKIDGAGKLKNINIAESLLNIDNKATLEDLVVAAYNEAKHKADNNAANLKSNMLSGFNLPEGMKFPF